MPTMARVTKIVRASGAHFVADLDNGMMRVEIHNKQSLDLPAFKVPLWLNDAEFEAFVLDMLDQSPDAIIRRRVFIGVFPGALVFADREREEHGDYKKLASLPYHTLELEWGKDVPPDIREWIIRDAAHYQAKRGDDFQISQCGQTVRLGG
jgi:hypothetical protein